MIRAAAIGWGLFLGAMLVDVCHHYGWDPATVGVLAIPVLFVLQGLVERCLRRRFHAEIGDA